MEKYFNCFSKGIKYFNNNIINLNSGMQMLIKKIDENTINIMMKKNNIIRDLKIRKTDRFYYNLDGNDIESVPILYKEFFNEYCVYLEKEINVRNNYAQCFLKGSEMFNSFKQYINFKDSYVITKESDNRYSLHIYENDIKKDIYTIYYNDDVHYFLVNNISYFEIINEKISNILNIVCKDILNKIQQKQLPVYPSIEEDISISDVSNEDISISDSSDEDISISDASSEEKEMYTTNENSGLSNNIWMFHGHGDSCSVSDETFVLKPGQTVMMIKHDAYSLGLGALHIREDRDKKIWKVSVESKNGKDFFKRFKSIMGNVLGVFSGDAYENVCPNIEFSKSDPGHFRTGLYKLPVIFNKKIRNYNNAVNKIPGYEVTSTNYSIRHYNDLQSLINTEFYDGETAIPFTLIILTCRGDETGLRGRELRSIRFNKYYYKFIMKDECKNKYLKYKTKYLELKKNNNID